MISYTNVENSPTFTTKLVSLAKLVVARQSGKYIRYTLYPVDITTEIEILEKPKIKRFMD